VNCAERRPQRFASLRRVNVGQLAAYRDFGTTGYVMVPVGGEYGDLVPLAQSFHERSTLALVSAERHGRI
jgi:hypothetical protein